QVEISPLTISFLKGFLEPMVEEAGSINFVNAPILARERGINVEEVKRGEAGDYTALISVAVESDAEKEVAGTLFGNDDPRIVLIDGYRVDVVPQGNILVVPHQDKPKIIGPVGNLIGAHDINIAGMQVGRKVLGGKAIMILSVDEPVPDKTLAEIEKVDGVYDVKMVTL
ncbi:MAG: phosphoglycerate dehydrogenase, partial [Firmicutes bacterium HGW-Firmicutes-14]